MKTLLASMLALIGFLAVPLSAAPLTFEWDPAPPEDGAVTYTVQKKVESSPGSGLWSWEDVGDTTSTTFSIGTPEPVRTLYRLKITNEAGKVTYDANEIADRPAASNSFRLKPAATAYVPADGPALASLFNYGDNLLSPAPASPRLE
jgi:hypothetical protein